MDSDYHLSNNKIHVLDLGIRAENVISTHPRRKELATKLTNALTKNGFVFLINHGISEEKLKSSYNIMDTFCALPDHVKNQYKMNLSRGFHGYFPEGMEQLREGGATEIKHCYNITSLSDKLPTKEIYNFQEDIGGLSKEFIELSNFLLKIIAEALEWDPEALLNAHKGMLEEGNLTTLRMVYYPPLETEPSTNVTRCGEHTDWGTFSLIAQDVDGGLELFYEGEWRPVEHLNGAILMFLGDLMEKWSSSQCKSMKHRVVIPKGADLRNKGRHSVIFFVNPVCNTLMEPWMFQGGQYSKVFDENVINKNCGNEVSALDHILNKYKDSQKHQEFYDSI